MSVDYTLGIKRVFEWAIQNTLRYQALGGYTQRKGLCQECIDVMKCMGSYIRERLEAGKAVRVDKLGVFRTVTINKDQWVIFEPDCELKLQIDQVNNCYRQSDQHLSTPLVQTLNTKQVSLMARFDPQFVKAVISTFVQSLLDLLSLGRNLTVQIPCLIVLRFKDRKLTYKGVSNPIKRGKTVGLKKESENFRRKQNIDKWNSSILGCLKGQISGNQIKWYFNKGRQIKAQQLKSIRTPQSYNYITCSR